MGLRWVSEDSDVEPHSIPDDEAWGVRIDDEEFVEGDSVILIYEDSFSGFDTRDLPEGFAFELVNYFDHNGSYEQGSLPFEITKAAGRLVMKVQDFAWPKGRQQELDPRDLERLRLLMTVVDDLRTREGWVDDVVFEEDDAYYGAATLTFSIAVDAIDAAEAFAELSVRYDMIDGRIQALLGERSLDGILTSGDEAMFTREIVIPTLERLGMLDVRYVHGTDEHGRDVVYRYQHPLGFDVLGCVQCKAGDVTGRVGRMADEIIAQVQDAFAFPVYDLNAKSERQVSEVIIAISGEFKGPAVQRLRHRIPKELAGRVWFWSGKDFRDMRGRP